MQTVYELTKLRKNEPHPSNPSGELEHVGTILFWICKMNQVSFGTFLYCNILGLAFTAEWHCKFQFLNFLVVYKGGKAGTPPESTSIQQ
jgi:hypothetical protein